VEGFTYNYYEDLTPEDVIKIVDTLKAGGQPKVGRTGERVFSRTGQGVVAFGLHQEGVGLQGS
jgi:hypothetical protein